MEPGEQSVSASEADLAERLEAIREYAASLAEGPEGSYGRGIGDNLLTLLDGGDL